MTEKSARPAAEQDKADQLANAKRHQILDGARRVFRANGYDGASMETIAREAGVSKGTLYVYFDSKEALFKALILKDRRLQPEHCLDNLDDQAPLAEALTRLGCAYLARMLMPETVSTMRMVIGASEKFPEFGALLYEEGPKKGTRYLKQFLLHRQELGQIIDCDLELAASQFMDLSVAGTLRRVLLVGGGAPSEADQQATIASAVRVFMNTYAVQKS